jgi:hypothetical protein
MVLVFFTFCYILVDNGMRTLNAEVRKHLREKRMQLERVAKKKFAADDTLQTGRITTIARKS